MKNLQSRSKVYASVSSNYIRQYAYEHGADIYQFMNAHNVGHSVYGEIMDAAAHGKGVIAHRLYGHHLVYDLPISNVSDSYQFLEHEFSDLFTKQGLPILPGEVLEDVNLLKACDKLGKSWNFVNGFDILSGTISIYSGLKDLDIYFREGMPITEFEDVAKTIGVGAIELAIAMSSANPFLLIGAAMQITAGIRGVFNSGARYYFKCINNRLTIEFANQSLDMRKLNRLLSIREANRRFGIRKANEGLGIREANAQLGMKKQNNVGKIYGRSGEALSNKGLVDSEKPE